MDGVAEKLQAKRVEPPKPAPTSTPPPKLADDRLFETQQELTGSTRNYLKAFGLIVLVLAAAGAALFYFTLPDIGDQVRASRGAEAAVRDSLLLNQKRTATDIVFYKCNGFYWARVGVETRTDVANPLMRVPYYYARLRENGDSWDVAAAPITAPELDRPCN